MVGVLKIERVSYSASNEDVKNLFRNYGVCPEDIHWLKNEGRSARSAFLAFRTNKEVDQALDADGNNFLGQRVSVIPSSPLQFNDSFPSKPLFSNDTRAPKAFRGKNNNRNQEPFDAQNRFNNNGGRASNRHVFQGDQERHVAKQQYSNSYKRNDDNRTQSGGPRGRESFMEKRDSTFNKGNFNKFDQPSRDRVGMFHHSAGGNFSGNDISSGRKYPGSDRNGNPQFNSRNNDVNNTERRSRRVEERPRSRSPVDRASGSGRGSYHQKREPEGYRQNEQRRQSQGRGPGAYDVNERKFLRMTGLSYKSTPADVKEFFHPHKVVKVFLLKFTSGAYVGKLSGSAMVEFATEQVAHDALGYDGTKCGSRTISVFRAAKEDIVSAIEDSLAPPPSQSRPGELVADVHTLNALANTNPEVQHLVGLLNAAVTNIATGSQQQTHPGRQGRGRENPGHVSTERSKPIRSNDDPVINRVASSANINVDDIKNGRVVGMRNLPYSVTPELILNLFDGYHPIGDSVRIHYLDNGRCSGDAIICFRGNREARKAVRDLNKKIVNNRKVELFFL